MSFNLASKLNVWLMRLLIVIGLLISSVTFSRAYEINVDLPILLSKYQYQQILHEQKKNKLWFNGQRLSLGGRELHSLLDDLGLYGDFNNYQQIKQNEQLWDFYLTQGLVNLLQLVNSKLSIEKHIDRVSLALKSNEEEELLFAITPQFDQVSLLRSEIAKYKLLAKSDWPYLDSDFRPKLGQSHPKVKNIRHALFLLGYLPKTAQRPSRIDIYDSVVISAIKKFQNAHGLLPDGKLGPKTYRALSISPSDKLTKLQVNLQRWFLLPNELPSQYLLVNIPSYQLQLIDGGIKKMEMKVIVGTKKNQTPQMVTYINKVTVNPTWTPTFNIIKNDLVPEYKQDYLALKRKNFQLVKGYREQAVKKEITDPNLNLISLMKTYRLVQAPGDNNALGLYRFNIPNNQSIYLHDTPQKSLFNNHVRALSHGCVRLERANDLAEYLLEQYSEGFQSEVKEALSSGKTTHLPLSTDLKVFITYQTTWVDETGKLQFLPDIYHKDQEHKPIAQFDATDSNIMITLSNNNS